jgi:hypothetical protein
MFFEALEKDPTNAQIWANVGYVFIEIGKLHKAQICVERLKSLDVEQAVLLQRAIDYPEFRARGVIDLFIDK